MARLGVHRCRKEIRQLIRTMSRDNPLWGAPRIHGELLKLGIDIGETSVGKYIARRRKPPSQTWRTFLGIENSKSVGKVALPAIVTGNRCRNNHLGLGKCSRTGAVLESGRTSRERPTLTELFSGGASFVTMVKTADLRDRDHSTQLRRMHFPWFRRLLLQRHP